MKGVTELIKDEGDQADLTPLIDCVFLLLLFFLVTSTFSEQSFFEVELPKAKNAGVATIEDACILDISEKGNFAIGGTLLTEAELGPYIEKLSKEREIPVFVINGHKNTPYEKIALAIDIAQGLQVGKLSFTVEQ
jgi:biopolymer transport protein ExbD